MKVLRAERALRHKGVAPEPRELDADFQLESGRWKKRPFARPYRVKRAWRREARSWGRAAKKKREARGFSMEARMKGGTAFDRMTTYILG